MPEYAVVDVETTGFSPAKGDRVLEIGVVLLDERAEVEDAWETLVNPQRHVGATHVHGIEAADVLGAPLFSDIAGALAHRLAGRTFVAHNARFDASFVGAEMRAAQRLLDPQIPYLDTMVLARTHLDLPGGAKLSDCCDFVGVVNTNAHSALADAFATAEVLRHLAHETPAMQDSRWWDSVERSLYFAGRYIPGDPVAPILSRAQAREAREVIAGGGWVQRAAGTRHVAEHSDEDRYFTLLDGIFLDREVSAAEQEQLLRFARDNDLSHEAIRTLNTRYLESLVAAAWSDGVLTYGERLVLTGVAHYFGVDPAAVIPRQADAADAHVSARAQTLGGTITLAPGDRVTVTCPERFSRDEWDDFFSAHGVKVAGIAKATKVLVAGRADTQSGKAKKAREYGIPVITEEHARDRIRFEE